MTDLRRARSLPRLFCWLVLALSLMPITAMAIHPGEWVHTTEADFEPGQTESVIVTNLGDVKLAHKADTLGEPLEEATIIYDLQALADGTVYIAAGPEARLLRRKGDQIEKVLELKDEQIFSLDVTADGKLLVCISGAASRLAVLDGDKLTELTPLPGVRYVWDVLVDGQTIYVATGTDGRLLMVDLAAEGGPAVAELLDADQANLLCLGRDAAGRIYAGSDSEGLLYRVTMSPDRPAAKVDPDAESPESESDADAEPQLPKVPGTEVFVVYDADEPEIGALLLMPDGTIYIGTADAEQARPGRLAKPAASQTGRPEPEAKPEPEQQPAQAVEPDAEQQAAPDDQSKAADVDATQANGPDDSEPLAVADDEQTPPSAGEPKVATSDQLEQLRTIAQERLIEARTSGSLNGHAADTLQAGPRRPGSARPSAPTAVRSRPARPTKNGPKKKGNAVYRISARGFVDEVFRESVMVLKLLVDGDKLLVATGSEGQIFSLDVERQETALLVDLEPSQVPAMARVGGEILLGTANPASLVRLGRGYAAEGKFTSAVLDASQLSSWGQFKVTADVPKDTSVSIRTRSGNVADPEHAPWSDWSAPSKLGADAAHPALAPRYLPIASERARFLQYQLTLTGSTDATPAVDRVAIAYVVANLKPSIAAIKATYPGAKAGGARQGGGSAGKAGGKGAAGAPATKLKLEWTAADPNKDRLRFKLEYEMAGSGVWLTLEEDLTVNRYEWQTLHVPNGRYTVRVTATDAADNAPNTALTANRSSDPILVDNSPPTLQTERPRGVQANGKAVVTIRTTATDELSPIRAVHYAVDSDDLWQMALPADDMIYDSTSERITITIPDLAPGRHAIRLRATDARGNATYQALFVDVK